MALDVETANADLASICQIGLVEFDLDGPVTSWQTLVNPQDMFDPMNVSIHGITEEQVREAPLLPHVADHIRATMAGAIIVCHTAFDTVAVRRAFEKYQLPHVDCRWLDSARVTRRVWPEFMHRGYGLANVAKKLGIAFSHHEAKEDARAAGHIVLRAITQSGLSVDDWLVRAARPMTVSVPIDQDGNPDGPLFGEVVVFTGALSMHRHEAAAMAAAMGCRVGVGVTKHTTLLVVGDQDVRRLAGHDKSSKHRKVETLIAQGQPIRILCETDFRAVACTGPPGVE